MNRNVAVRTVIILVLVCLVGFQIRNIRNHTESADTQIIGGRTGLPPNGAPENPAVDKGPLHVDKAIHDAKQLYADIQTYRRYHNGEMPDKEMAFEVDRMNNYKQYGYASFSQAKPPFGVNPDMQFSDVSSFRDRWQYVNPFVICLKRPDGSDIGGPKQPGTRDILAYSRMYFHLNARHYNGFKDTINPSGFFLVVWDNGEVQQVPYKDEMFVKQANTRSYLSAFHGQSGVPDDAITFDNFYKLMPRS